MKKVANHTPGPWVVKQGDCDGSGAFSINAHTNGRTVFVAETIGGLDEEEDNAHLIAAAPDLLEALEELLAHASSVGIGLYYEVMARAAIAIARGE